MGIWPFKRWSLGHDIVSILGVVVRVSDSVDVLESVYRFMVFCNEVDLERMVITIVSENMKNILCLV